MRGASLGGTERVQREVVRCDPLTFDPGRDSSVARSVYSVSISVRARAENVLMLDLALYGLYTLRCLLWIA